MVKVAGGGCDRRRNPNYRKIRLMIKPTRERNKAGDIEIYMLSDGLIKALIPAATKATVAGGRGGRRSWPNTPVTVTTVAERKEDVSIGS